MIIHRLQKDLEEIYGLDPTPSVEGFLISKEEMEDLVDPGEALQPRVLIREGEGEVELAVYLGLDQLNPELLADFCSVAEEISHFVYLTWNAQNLMPVSLLDLELQGEIDKFLLASRYFSEAEDLFAKLFEQFSFHEELSEIDLERYLEAHRMGVKFLRSLGDMFSEGAPTSDALKELRNFYRQTSPTRLSSIEKL